MISGSRHHLFSWLIVDVDERVHGLLHFLLDLWALHFLL
eukprot:COSAG06_NODE_531_length_14564_cov_23.708400_9_plen_39_part_00